MTKQAAILSPTKEQQALKECRSARERVILLLSIKAGLRAVEIAGLKWGEIDFEGGCLWLKTTKGGKPRRVPMAAALIDALAAYKAERGDLADPDGPVLTNQHQDRGAPLTANAVTVWLRYFYERRMDWTGFSSHSGRRTFVTRAAKAISAAGGTLKDVQRMVGHTDIRMTARYIEADEDAQKRVVDMI